MTWFVGTIAAAVLLALSALHVYWALGGQRGVEVTIPTRDGRPLFSPGSSQTLIIAGLLSASAFVLLGRLRLWGSWLPRWLFEAGSWTLAVVFGARVVGDFRWFGLFKRMRDTPFARWDTRLYVPLCALLAIAALLVAG